MTTDPTDLLTGLASVIDGAGLGIYDPDRVWTAADTATAVVLAVVPQAPDNLIALTPYPVLDGSLLADSTVGVQIRCRAARDPLVALRRSGALFDLLHDLGGVALGSIWLALMTRQSGVFAGQDANQRCETSDNYYCRVNWPTQHRPD
jgi:hypothetical protein